MLSTSYRVQRGRIEAYFDRTAVDSWARLTSSAPVGRIRASVRAGRTQMRDTLLSWLPGDLRGASVLDAGCGTGALASEAARLGARVVAVDLSPTLVALARERIGRVPGAGSVEFLVGDMLDPALGRFDYVVAMDSLIHYVPSDAVIAATALAGQADRALLFTFAPSTPALRAMHAIGRLFPRDDRAPAIHPIAEQSLVGLLRQCPDLAAWRVGRSQRVASGFYTAQALELVKR